MNVLPPEILTKVLSEFFPGCEAVQFRSVDTYFRDVVEELPSQVWEDAVSHYEHVLPQDIVPFSIRRGMSASYYRTAYSNHMRKAEKLRRQRLMDDVSANLDGWFRVPNKVTANKTLAAWSPQSLHDFYKSQIDTLVSHLETSFDRAWMPHDPH